MFGGLVLVCGCLLHATGWQSQLADLSLTLETPQHRLRIQGDLLAAAGGSWVVGRESRAKYNETMAGRRPDDFTNNGYEFTVRVDPYDAQGHPLPLLSDADVGVPGDADGRVQAYNFRLCSTNEPGLAAPFPALDRSSKFARPDTFELGRRIFANKSWGRSCPRYDTHGKFPCFDQKLPGDKKNDWNNPFLGFLNTDCVTGCNQSGFVAADLVGRLKIWQDHQDYYLGLLQFYTTDPAVPADVRAQIAAWGLCRDEFGSTGHWPPNLYVTRHAHHNDKPLPSL